MARGIAPKRADTPFPQGGIDSIVARRRPELPLHILDPDGIEAAARRFCAGFPGKVMYAVKVNPAPAALAALAKGGIAAFDVASIDEVRQLRALVPGAELHFMHPVKSREAIAESYIRHGVRSFALDCPAELEKILQETERAPDLSLAVRIAVGGEAAAISLAGKFGIPPAEAPALLRRCRPYAGRLGLTFHVGSQCMDPGAYAAAISLAAGLIRESGVAVEFLDVGGGFPSRYPGMEPPPPEAFFRAIAGAVRAEGLSHLDLLAEPGRALVAESGSLVLRVELRKGDLLYLNDGTYGGLFDAGKSVGFRFPCRRIRPGGETGAEMTPFRLAGPTCDSLDMMAGPFMLPADMQEGDWIEFGGLGAYCRSMRTDFNGFGECRTVILKSKGPKP
jgi:ornithine decarboxylase